MATHNAPPGTDAGHQEAPVTRHTRGPVPKTKAAVGGFSIIGVPSREKALRWATRIAESCRCAQDVREIMFDPQS